MKWLLCAFLVLLCGQADARPRGIAAYPCALAPVSGDGCGVSPGLYFAPAVSSTTAPTAAQWGTYARQSGQTWASDHPQGFNVAFVDYGGGPNALVSSLTDIASWPAGQNQCTYFANGTGTGVPASWPAGWPILVCTGSTQADFTISGYNFGPTAYQGNPVGNHDCVNLVINPSNTTTYNPTITIKGNAFINGATCAPLISGVRYGLISAVAGIKSSLIIWNNYVDGRNDDAGKCCLVPTNQGFFVSTNNHKANFDFEFNYILRMPSPPVLLGWATGNEAAFPCTNGTAYQNAGYTLTNQYNYSDNFGFTYGGGHWEIVTMSSLGTLCARYDQYNTVRWAPTTAAEGAATLFGLTNNNGTAQLWRVKRNTIITNLVAGRSVPALYEYYDWHTDAGNPNHIIIDGAGSSCSGLGWSCPGPVRGQSITGGSNNTNTFNSQVGLQDNTGTGPITGSAWNGGCNQQDNASGLCPTNGNFPSLAAGVLIPTDYPTHKVTNSFFNNRVVSEAGAQADHGTTANSQFGYGVLDWEENYIDGTGSGTAANNTPFYWEANPATGPSFTATGSGTNLTVSAISSGTISIGLTILGTGIPANTTILSQTSGPAGGTGVYVTSNATTVNGNVTGAGYQFNGGGGCAQAGTIANNIDLRSGDGTTYPINQYSVAPGGGC